MPFVTKHGWKLLLDGWTLSADCGQDRPDVAMDLPLICSDDNQTQSPPALADSQTGDLDVRVPVENKLSAYGTRAELATDLSEPADKSPETLSNISERLSGEKATDSNSPSGYSMSLGSELAPNDGGFRVWGHFGSSEHALPLLPQLSNYRVYRPSVCQISDLKHESALSATIVQENRAQPTFGATAWPSEGSIEPSSTEPLSNVSVSSGDCQATNLLRSLSHQSDSLESDTATEPVSDLYIFESETQDFTPTPNVDPPEMKCSDYQTLSHTGEEKVDSECNTENVWKQCHQDSIDDQTMVDYKSNLSCDPRLQPPAVGAFMSENDGRRWKAEVTDETPQLQRSDSPIELWLDACQYAGDEGPEDWDVLDRTCHSVTLGGLKATGDLSFPTGQETQVSGYDPDGSNGIGWTRHDTKGWGPPVERWSSVDSWATALSDWTGIITTTPEDFTAAFTEIGAEIDALTQALAEVHTHIDTGTANEAKGQEAAAQAHSQPPMGVQDQPLETQNVPEGSVLAGQSCFSLCLHVPGPELQDREVSQRVQRDSVQPLKPEDIHRRRVECSPCPTRQWPSMGSSGPTLGSSGGYGLGLITCSASPGGLDLCPFDGFVNSMETDCFISNEEDPIVLNIMEDTDLESQNVRAEFKYEEPFGDRLCEVTDEHSVSQPGSVDGQEAEGGCKPAEVDREGTKSSTYLHSHTAHTLTHRLLPGVDTRPGRQCNVHTHVSSDGACQLEPRWESPQFIMPLAPLGIGSSPVCWTNSSLERDQTCEQRSLNDNRELGRDPVQPRVPWPTVDGNTEQQCCESKEELIHKKEKAIYSSKTYSSQIQVDLSARQTISEEIDELSRELSNLADIPEDHFIISEEERVAYVTLELKDPFVPRPGQPLAPAGTSEKAVLNQKTVEKMPHRSHKSNFEGKSRSKKDKAGGHHVGAQASKKQEASSLHVSAQQVCTLQDASIVTGDDPTADNSPSILKDKEARPVTEAAVATEKAPSKPHGKKKKKHAPHATGVKVGGEPLVEVENGAKPKTARGRIDLFEAKLDADVEKGKKQNDQPHGDKNLSQPPAAKASEGGKHPTHPTDHKDQKPKNSTNPLKDDVVKKRRLSQDKFGRMLSALEAKLPKADVSIQAKREKPKVDAGEPHKKAYSEVVKQNIPPKEELKVSQPIQAASVSGDPQGLCLWCQFDTVSSYHTVIWSRDGTLLEEIKRSAGDESRVSLTICNASHKDLGKYQCRLSTSHGSLSLEYLLTYEVLSEIVIPPVPTTTPAAPVDAASEEEDAHCSRLLFKEDFLTDQFFGENQPISIVTEKDHFGEGMHRRAFRTKMQEGQIPPILPGHPCVLKVHTAVSYGTKDNEELVQKNFTLAVEECQVQNTAREYIKAYTTAAQSTEAFGETPEIIPIYLVHRPSNDIPYATLEEELMGDFVKYSVKDGKEINLLRRDSDAGQKCCAFQHWVFHKTDGNLLVTDMQGVGLRLTDVGIATCKKGYKGFKGNCSTSFIDQFKALHQCNKYCEILGLQSMQPKPKRHGSAPKPKPKAQPSAAPKKKTFGPTVKSKS